jgi:hypothetical protein
MIAKKLLAALAVACTMFSAAPARAAGPYDGIYQVGSTFYFLIQNPAGFLAVSFDSIPSSGVTYYLGDGQSFNPTRADMGDLYVGAFVYGTTAILVGETAYGACIFEYSVVFDSAGATATREDAASTSLGQSRGIDCWRFYRYMNGVTGRTFRMTKVF